MRGAGPRREAHFGWQGFGTGMIGDALDPPTIDTRAIVTTCGAGAFSDMVRPCRLAGTHVSRVLCERSDAGGGCATTIAAFQRHARLCGGRFGGAQRIAYCGYVFRMNPAEAMEIHRHHARFVRRHIMVDLVRKKPPEIAWIAFNFLRKKRDRPWRR
jgi:hypothetical protein